MFAREKHVYLGRFILRALPAATLVAVSFSASMAQVAQPPRPAAREQLTRLVDGALPGWDASILDVPPQPQDWATATPLGRIAEVVADPELAAEIRNAPNGTRLVRTKGSALRLNPDQGELRYHSRARSVDPSSAIAPLQPQDRARELALEVFRRLGIPETELGSSTANTQVSGGAPVGTDRIQAITEMYRVVTVSRQIRDLPVFMSSARMAVNPRGEVQRLQIRWPRFSIDRSERVLPREDVLALAVDTLVDQNASTDAKISARLGYEEKSTKGKSEFVPVVLFSVVDPPTPFIFSVPVVAPGANDD
jgi:hypothetical protein